jgi:hypothetical protein
MTMDGLKGASRKKDTGQEEKEREKENNSPPVPNA